MDELEEKALNIVKKIEQGDHEFTSNFFAAQKNRYLEMIENEPTAAGKNQIVQDYNHMAELIHDKFNESLSKASYGVLKSNVDWRINKTFCTCDDETTEPNEKNEMKAVLRGINQMIIQDKKNEKEAFKQAFKSVD